MSNGRTMVLGSRRSPGTENIARDEALPNEEGSQWTLAITDFEVFSSIKENDNPVAHGDIANAAAGGQPLASNLRADRTSSAARYFDISFFSRSTTGSHASITNTTTMEHGSSFGNR